MVQRGHDRRIHLCYILCLWCIQEQPLQPSSVPGRYVVPILRLLGHGGSSTESLFLSGMYSFSKLCFTLIASFFFVDAIGRRASLFTGAVLQVIRTFILVYIKYQQVGHASFASGRAAFAALFIHAFGYAVGMRPKTPRAHKRKISNI